MSANFRTSLGLGLLSLGLLQGCSSLGQRSDQALSREPGRRFLGHPVDVAVEAHKDWQFAWLSASAYNAHYIESTGAAPPLPADVGQQLILANRAKASDCPKPEDALKAAGWIQWDDFPSPTDDGLLESLRKVHLRVEVWEHPEKKSVVVAFGGTVFTNASDWMSNLRWFLPLRHDEYTEIQRVLGPAFVKQYRKRAADSRHAYLRMENNPRLFSTGHSLGGGLAQQFAYALPFDSEVPRVERVFAFDPSPVTGYYSVPVDVREKNSKRLAIDRVYERGEILAAVRSLTSFVAPPDVDNPKVRGVRYALFYNAETALNSVASHSIPVLACRLNAAKDREPGAEVP